MYRVIKNFNDLLDGNHRYLEGDTYPRDGYKPSEDRIKELSSTSNKRGVQLIEEIKVEKKLEKVEDSEIEEEPKVEKKKKK